MKMIDKLCHLLDERGVPHTDSYTALNQYRVVSWRDKNYREVDAIDYFDDSEHQLRFYGYGFPEEIVNMSLDAEKVESQCKDNFKDCLENALCAALRMDDYCEFACTYIDENGHCDCETCIRQLFKKMLIAYEQLIKEK